MTIVAAAAKRHTDNLTGYFDMSTNCVGASLDKKCMVEGGGSKIAQWIKELAAKSDALNLMLKTHIIEGEN